MKKQKSVLRRLKREKRILIKRDLVDVLTMSEVH